MLYYCKNKEEFIAFRSPSAECTFDILILEYK